MRKRFEPTNKNSIENEDHIIELVMRRFPIVHSVLRDNEKGNDDDQTHQTRLGAIVRGL